MKIKTLLFVCMSSIVVVSVYANHSYEERNSLFEKLVKRSEFSFVQEEEKSGEDVSSFIGMAGDGKLVGNLRLYRAGVLAKIYLFGESNNSCQTMEFYPDGLLTTIQTGTWRIIEYEGSSVLYCTTQKYGDLFSPLGQPFSWMENPGLGGRLGQELYSPNYRIRLFQWLEPEGKRTIWYYLSVKDQSEDGKYRIFGKTAVAGVYDKEEKKFSIAKVTHYLGESQFQMFDKPNNKPSVEIPIKITFVDWQGVTNLCDWHLTLEQM